MGSQDNPFGVPSSFVTAPFSTRKKGFTERLIDEMSDLTLKQTLGLPVSAPLNLGAGALKGVSFGLLDFDQQIHEGLGDFALPEAPTTALDIAGQIGGSFIPYIGAGKVAGTIFKGMSLGHKLATGALTFGAPELARQALHQELDPLALARSVATGASFALPLPRIALAPAVAGTELLFGATPTEAGVAGLFAGLFGPMGSHRTPGKNQELPVAELPRGGAHEIPPGMNPNIPEANPSGVVGPFSARFPTVQEVLKNLTTPGAGPQATAAAQNLATSIVAMDEALVSGTTPSRAVNPLEALSNQRGRISPRQRQAAAVGQLEFDFPPPASLQTQLGLLDSAAAVATGPEAGTLRTISAVVKQAQAKPAETLMAELNTAIDTAGPESVQARVARLALAQKQSGFVPPGAPMRSSLKPPVRGLNLIEPGPANPFEVRAAFEDLMMQLRTGGAAGRTREAQLWELLTETRSRVAKARGRGEELAPQEVAEVLRKQEALLSTADIAFQSQDEAYRVALLELGTKSSAGDVNAFVENLPEYYRPLSERLLAAGKAQKATLEEVAVETGAKEMRAALSRQPKGFREFITEASDAGASINPRQRTTTRGGKPRTVIDTFDMMGSNGQHIRQFKSVEAGRKWLRELEAGPASRLEELGVQRAVPRAIEVEQELAKLGMTGAETLRLTLGERSILDLAFAPGKVGIINIRVPDPNPTDARNLFRALGREMKARGLTEKSEVAFNILNDRPGPLKRLGAAGIRKGLTDAGGVDPANIHELRALAFGRGVVVDAVGEGRLVLTEQLTGSTIANVQNLQEAVAIVRRAPNLTAVARELGPRATVLEAPMPGTGGLGGLASEQSPAATICPIGNAVVTLKTLVRAGFKPEGY